MSTQPESTKPYVVLKIDEMTRLADAGGVERYYRVKMKTEKGIIISVELEVDELPKDKATPILTKKAKEADSLMV